MTRRTSMMLLALVLASLVSGATTAHATSCSDGGTQRQEFEAADVVAELLLLRVEPASSSRPDGDQMLLFRFVRIYKGPRALQEGDEHWIRYQHMSTAPWRIDYAGSSHIAYLRWEPVMVMHMCRRTDHAGSVTRYMLRSRRAREQ